MKTGNKAIAAPKPRPVSDWTLERVARLQKQEIEQLRENGRALGADDVVSLCDTALRALPKTARKAKDRNAPAA
jgi:hypothetical protein